jgi:hypothetical protein
MAASDSGQKSEVGFSEHWERTFDSIKRKKFLTNEY